MKLNEMANDSSFLIFVGNQLDSCHFNAPMCCVQRNDDDFLFCYQVHKLIESKIDLVYLICLFELFEIANCAFQFFPLYFPFQFIVQCLDSGTSNYTATSPKSLMRAV